MLVLSRKVHQTLTIGEGENQVTITVLSIDGNRIRIGATAPKSVRVVRGELKKGKAA